MSKYITLLISTLLFSTNVFANGLITLKSAHSVPDTANRLVSALQNKGMTVFARIDHSEGANAVGQELRPTQLIIFGNPKVGTPLMQCSQTMAIDLPQKALIWEDASGSVWFTYNKPQYLSKRHAMTDCNASIAKVDGALSAFAKLATMP